MLLLIVPVMISLVTYVKTAQIIENKTNSSNILLLKKIKKQMDSTINDINLLSQEITFNPRLNNLLASTSPINSVEPYRIYEIIRDLGSFRLPGRSLSQLYVYFKNMDLVISTEAGDDSKSFYETYLSGSYNSFEQWKEVVSGTYTNDFVVMPSTDGSGEARKTVFYIRTIPLIAPGKNSANIVVTLDDSRFAEDIKDIELLNKSDLVIINNKNAVISSSIPDATVKNSLLYEKMTGNSGVFHSVIEGKKVVVSYISSEIAKWKYIVIIPVKIFWEESKYVQNLTLFSLALCILIGSFIAYYSLRKNYNPIQKLLKSLENRQGLHFDKKNSEYYFIEQAIDKVYGDKEKSDRILVQQNKALRADFLSRFLKGKTMAGIPLQDALAVHGISFSSNFFAVVAFYIDDYSSIFVKDEPAHKELDEQENYKLVQFIIANVVEELMGQKNQGFMIEVDDLLVCLVNFKDGQVAGWKTEMARVVEEAQKFLNEKFEISFITSVSNVHETSAGVPDAFSEALQAMDYMKLLGIENTLYFEEITGLPKGGYYYPLEKETHLINYIKMGDLEKSIMTLDEIFDRNFSQSRLSLDISRCLMFNLVSTMIKTVNDMSTVNHDSFLDRLNPVGRLLACKNVNDMKHEMLEILSTFCEYVSNKEKEGGKSDETRLVREVDEYIRGNYTDDSLAITTIADKFGVNAVYLSKLFREHMAEGLLDYINKIRLEKAKLLYKEQKEKYSNWEKLARDVGYTNIKTFRRAFKRYEGITPGQYKDSAST